MEAAWYFPSMTDSPVALAAVPVGRGDRLLLYTDFGCINHFVDLNLFLGATESSAMDSLRLPTEFTVSGTPGHIDNRTKLV